MFSDLLPSKGSLTGIDISLANLIYGSAKLKKIPNIHLAMMNASKLGFKSGTFDITLCLQNGLSAFHENPLSVITEAVRITKPGGIVLFSGYTDKIWDARMDWFIIQSKFGLLGEIDFETTGNGKIVCKDGFFATTYREDDYSSFASQLGLEHKIFEVDDSCLMLQIDIPE